MSWYELAALLLLTLAPASETPPPPEAATVPRASTEGKDPSWESSLTVYWYIYPDDSSYLQPTASVDHGWLHLEARYNDEALQTGSLWVGWNLAWGEGLKLSLTPLVGGVFGKVNGIAPGLEWSLAWGPLELYSENEFVIDLVDVDQSFFVAWSELTVRPFEWLRTGLALQRTRAHAVPRVVSWGPFVGLSIWKLEVAAYWFNPGEADAQYWAAYVGLNL